MNTFSRGAGDTIGDYEILSPLSSGGMGEVYLARKVVEGVFEKRVAIKTLKPDVVAQAGQAEAFLDEARLVAKLDHSGIAQVHDVGIHNASPFVVMEFVDGVSLAKILAANGKLTPEDAVQVVGNAARALHSAHEARASNGAPLSIVHRDVSPQNIMISSSGEIKLIDFGIALSQERLGPDTRTGVIKGKPGYMAPEQLNGGVVDRRADVFALGVVLFECLSGEPLFARENLPATVTAILHSEVASLVGKIEGVGSRLDAAVRRALDKDPSKRFASALEFATELMAAMPRNLENYGLGIREVASELSPVPLDIDNARIDRQTLATTELETEPARRTSIPLGASLIAGTFALVGLSVWLTTDHPSDPRVSPVSAPTASPVAPPDAKPEPPRPGTAVKAARSRISEGNDTKRAVRRRTRKPKAGRKDPEPAPIARGQLTVRARPYGIVRIDGVRLSDTPITDQSISAGSHLLELLDPETEDVRERRKITIEPGKTLRLVFR